MLEKQYIEFKITLLDIINEHSIQMKILINTSIILEFSSTRKDAQHQSHDLLKAKFIMLDIDVKKRKTKIERNMMN